MSHKHGRIRPKVLIPGPRFLVGILHDGTVFVVPQLAWHYDTARDEAPPPATLDWTPKMLAALQQMYGNDTEGDCVIASILHQFGLWTGNETGTPAVATTQEALTQYATICGPGDQGCVITSVLDYAQATGMTLAGKTHKLGGYVSVDWTNPLALKVAIDLFGTVKFGINLPQAWDDAPDGGLWDVTSGAGAVVVGGHDVCAYGYDSTGVVIGTWGSTRTITWAALAINAANTNGYGIEECYAELAPDWYSAGNLAPNGINAATLANDLQVLGGGGIPDPGPPPTPPTPVPPPTPIPPTPIPPGPAVDPDIAPIKAYFASLIARNPGRPWNTALPQIEAGVLAAIGVSTSARKLASINWPAVLAAIPEILPLIEQVVALLQPLMQSRQVDEFRA
jgi:hypothetical protein